MAKETGRKLVAQNRKARHDYHIEDTFEAGLVLAGTEVKSLRAGRASLVDGFAEVTNGRCSCTRAHPDVHRGHLDQPRAPPASASCCSTAHEIDKIDARCARRASR